MELSRGLGLETYAQVMAAGFLAYNLCGQGRVDEARQLIETAMWPYMDSSDTYEICVCRSVLADIALESGQMGEADPISIARGVTPAPTAPAGFLAGALSTSRSAWWRAGSCGHG